MGRSRVYLLFLCLIAALISVPVQAQFIDPGQGALLIVSPVATMGELKSDPFDPRIEYFEAEDALGFLIFSLVPNWQLFLSGTDFVSGAERIPLERMEWRLKGGNYRRMPSTGREQEVLKNNKNLIYTGNLSFRMVLKGDENPGRYNSTLTLSMVFP